MEHHKRTLSAILKNLDLGASVAEADTLLETARIETSAFADLLGDRVDLIPGTKGSGKSALFRIFVDFLPDVLLSQRKVVVAHGIQAQGDHVFHAFSEQFSKLSEEEFISFWCIYLVSLANEHFIKGERYQSQLKDATSEIRQFQQACASARIPDIQAKRSLKDILEGRSTFLDHGVQNSNINFPATLASFKLTCSEKHLRHRPKKPIKTRITHCLSMSTILRKN